MNTGYPPDNFGTIYKKLENQIKALQAKVKCLECCDTITVTEGAPVTDGTTVGELRYDPTTNILYIWDGSAWLSIGDGTGIVGTTLLSPPVSAPAGDDPVVLVNQTTSEIWVWSGVAWENTIQVEQGLSMGSPIKLGDDAAGTTEPGIFTSNRFINQAGFDLQFLGLQNGLNTFLTIKDDGVLEFNRTPTDGGLSQILRIRPLQQDQGNLNFGVAIARSNNTSGARDNGIVSFGFNAGANGREDPTKEGFYQSWEEDYLAGSGDHVFERHHDLVTAAGVLYRYDTELISKTNTSNKQRSMNYSRFSFMDPRSTTTDGMFARFQWTDEDQSSFILAASGGSVAGATDGVELYFNRVNNTFQISRVGSMPASAEIYLSSFNRAYVNILNVSNYGPDAATALLGRAANEDIVSIPINSTLALTAGTLGVTGTGIDHGGLTGLADDDHPQYALLAGRATGQILYGGTAANEDIVIEGTSNATKTTSYVILQPTSGNVGIGTSTPTSKLHIKGASVLTFNNGVTDGFTIAQYNTNSWELAGISADSHLKISNANLYVPNGSLGVGTASPNANALLDVASTTKAFLPPRMTTVQKNAIGAPTAGMVVYDITLSKLCVYTTAWETITSV